MSKNVTLATVKPSSIGEKVVFSTHDMDSLIKGLELENYICGNCRFILAENVIPYSYKNLILQCPKCKSFNDIPSEGI